MPIADPAIGRPIDKSVRNAPRTVMLCDQRLASGSCCGADAGSCGSDTRTSNSALGMVSSHKSSRTACRLVQAVEPSAAEGRERRERAIVTLSQGAVAGDERLRRDGARCTERDRPDLAVRLDAGRLLQEQRRAADALVDGTVKMKERNRRWQRMTVGRAPVACEINLSHCLRRNATQLFLQGGTDGAAGVFRIPADRDPVVRSAAGIARVLAPAALNVEHVRQRESESLQA